MPPSFQIEPIAIVGLSGYLPGCMSVREFWQALDADRSLIEEIPGERFDWRNYYDPSGKDPGKTRCKWGGFIPDVAGFDAHFFKILPFDAKQIDPRQRLLLMSVYQTLCDAGYAPATLKKSRTGVYVAHQDDDYLQILNERGLDPGEGYGQASLLANRIAYFFDFRGPSEIVDAQCAGAAVALHRAVSALRSGEISHAIVSAANLLLRPQPFLALSRTKQLSRTNTVKSFQENADGHLRAEGVVSVMLKRLTQAEADGDFIYALISNTAVNFNGQGGTSSASPNIESHVELIERCYGEAGIDPRDVSYIEAQGMGNRLSDLAEWEAFNRALRSLAKARGVTLDLHSCRISTLKPLIGHMESTSALGALLKIVRSLETERIHKILGFSGADMALDTDNQPCVLASETLPWNKTDKPRLAGLHSFGMSGNNAHILIQEYRPSEKEYSPTQSLPVIQEFLIVLSAKSEKSLKALASELNQFLATPPVPDLKDIAHTLYNGREHMDYRMAMVVCDRQQLRAGLQSYIAAPDRISTKKGNPNVFIGTVSSAQEQDTSSFAGMQAIAAAWVQGSAISWPEHPTARRVPLPGYPFETQRYWLDEEIQPPPSLAAIPKTGFQDFAIDPGQSSEENLRRYLTCILVEFLDLPPDRIDENKHLQDYGIDSLAGMRVIRSLSETFDIEVLGRDLLQHPTIRSLSKHLSQRIDLEANSPSNPQVSEPENREVENFPLSEGQKGLWALQKSFPLMTAYNIPLCLKIRNIIDTSILSKALKSLLRQHPVLGYHLSEKDGILRQGLAPGTEIGINTEDVSVLDEQSILSKLREKSKQPFNLEQGPLIRVDLLQKSSTQTYLLICVHHIVFDGGSFLPLVDSLFDAYRRLLHGESPLAAPISTTYQDFVLWERQMLNGAWEKHRSYWRETLSGNLPVLELPTDRSRSKAQLFSGAVISTSIESSLAAQIQSFSKTQRVNPSTIFLALYKILLHRYTNLDDIIVGMPSMGRPQERFRSVVGYFINMVAIRSKGFSQQTFATFLENLKYTMSDGLDHARVPFTTVVRDIGILPNAIAAPVFQVAFEYQNGLAPSDLQHLCSCYGDLFDLEISFDIHQEGEYELVLEVFEEANGYRVSFKYNPSLYDATTIQQMLGHYLQLTQVAISNPNALVHKYEMMDDAELRLIQWDLNATSVEYPSNCVHQLFQAQVERTPNAVAVACGERTLSYEELNRKSTALAKYLQQQGVQSETLVAVCVERSLEMIVALLGIMKAGGAYVPLDPQFPQERLTYMLRDSGATFLVTQSWLNNRIGFIDAQYINLDRQWDEIEQAAESVEPLKCLAGLGNLAYVIYTSGSTGKPKGVTIEHRALTNFLCGMADQIGKQFVADFLAVTTYSFDIAALELFFPLIQGGRCTICDRDRLKDVEAIKAEIRRSKPTIMQATPSFWTMLLQSGWKNDENLKILCGGEMLNDSLRSMFASIGCEVWNLYGPTETTIWSMLAKIQPGDSVTIGKPIANTRVYILDAHDQLAPMGVPGELCIAGAGLARGYWDQPELTAQKFIDHPLEANNGSKLYRTGDLCCWLPNGTLQHLGRLDLQVKIRGFRIELEEVERELSRHPAVVECAIVAKERQGVQSLIGYYVPRQSDENNLLQDFDLIAHLKQRLPDYAIPTAFVSLDRIPLTANGKVDRKSLANQEVAIQRKTEKVTAKTETEAILADIWKNVLNVTDISINDGFFAAGGDSVLSVILADRIARRFNREFSVTSLFKYSTIRDIAAYLGDKQAEILGETPLQNPISASHEDGQDRAALAFDNAKGEALQDSLAIIGISCHFPDAPNHYQFWQNICAGKESGQFFSEEELRQAGVSEDSIQNPYFVGVQRTIEGKGNFDPEFFNISPRNAVFMDPQFRLLLMHAWRAVEDAGYVSSEIPRTSVFISASNSGYNTLVDKAGIIEATDEYTAWMLSQSGTIPTTISYQLGFIGPSVFVHTNCSSSLAALSAAYQSLSLGQSDYALVGASTLLPKSEMGYLHRPGLNLSRDGHCRTFDAAADGLVAGEGVAVLLVKKAPLAIADGDRIYALIRGIGINNDGRDKAGFFAPSVRGQSQAIDLALTSTGIRAETIGYVEAHGTGTKLGDPIEIQALCDSYQKDTNQRQYCAIGSVKPNIGHLDTGAGLAGCIKVAMSLYHKKIPPSINFSQPNPAIDFERSPFFVVDRLREWEAAPWPRRAALSAFGIGGTNTHTILEEYLPSPRLSPEKLNSPVLMVLSARKDDRLKEYVESLVKYLEQGIAKPNDSSETEWLINLAYTLQCGRQPMEIRVAFITSSVEELLAKLRRFATDWQPFEGCYFGSPSRENQILKLFAGDEDIQGLLAQWLVKKNVAKLAQVWIQGVKVDWSRLYCDRLPSRISAPTYPFAPEYYWPTPNPSSVSFSVLAPSHAIDPLQHKNVSVSAQHYSYEFTGHEFFLADHQIRHNGSGRKVLPAVVYLEMVHRAVWQSISHSLPNLEYPGNNDKAVIVLSNVAWVQALFVDESPAVVELKLFDGALNQMRFEIGSTFKGKTSLHCHGDAAVRFNTAPTLNLLELQQQIQDRQLSSAECYEIFRTLGVDYGPAHHAIDTLFLSAGKTSDRQVLAKLVIPDAVAQEQSRYILHPSLLDAGLQSCVALLLTNSQESLRLALPSSLEQIEVYDSCAALMWAWVRFAPETKKDSPIQRIDIDLCTDDGKVSVRMKGFVAREIRQQDSDGAVTQHQPKPLISNEMPPGLGSVTLKPVWDRVAIAPQAERSKDSLTVVFGANQTWKEQIAQLDRAAVLVDSAKPQSVKEFSKQIELLGSIDRLLWLTPAAIKYALDDDRLVDEQESGVLQLFRLLKSLFESGYGKKSLALTVVTSQSIAVRLFETANPIAASIHGLVATLKSEYPHWRVRLLDIDGGELPSLGELFPDNDTADFPLLARRDKQWFARKLIPIAFESNDFPAYKQKGVYVAIGGAGGVGEVWSRHIIENYQAQVIWIGRRELNDKIREKQAKLAAFGSKPLYIQADARNKASLEKALNEIRQSYSCINGVVHTAIELQDQSLAQMSIARFRTGLFAKAETSVRLVQVFQHEPLDFVLFFSSLISFGESPGQANYAAGCTFLDAYAQQLGKDWAVSVKVMNWGYWGNAGVVADATYRERMRQNGIGSIESQQAMAALNRLLQGQIDQLAFINLLKYQALKFVIEDEVLSVVGSARSQTAHPVVENVAAEIRYSQQWQLIRTHRTDARDILLQNLLLANLSEMGVLNSPNGRSLPVTYYHKWLDESIRLLQQNDLLIRQGNVSSVEELWTTWQKARRDWEGSASVTAEIDLVERCLRSLPDILSGRKLPQDVIFPESSLRLVEPLYRGNPIADFFNEVIADAVVDAINSLDKGNGPIRILEVGAGTGGTTVGLLQKLQPYSDRIGEYCYTDISQAFLIHAQEHYAIDYPFLKVDRFNVEQPLSTQSIQPGSYDIVVATNVLHATKNIRQTVRNVKAAMREGGQVFVNEISGNSLFSHLTFGLLEGWWRFEDAEMRIPGCPALNSHTWKQVLQEEGFDAVKFPVEFAHDLGHQIVVATSNGVIRQPLLGKPHAEPESVAQTQPDDSSNVQTNSVVSLQERTTEFVRQTLSEATRTPANKVRLDTPFEQYGVDSIVQVGLIQKLEQVTGSLPNTILFEYSTTRELVDYLLAHHQEFLTVSFLTEKGTGDWGLGTGDWGLGTEDWGLGTGDWENLEGDSDLNQVL
ncbi:MAG: amino acid adenylation domain-containing protein, partial [Nostoc sp. JL34]|nr:amino acid adenylation domain-containing protein [Nostoc sp. JL34]